MAHVLKGDNIVVLAGKDKGKTGRVLRIVTAKNRVLVQGIGMIKKHVKPNPQANIKGGILQQEAAIHLSNVALIDGNGKATRVTIRETNGKRERVAKTTGELIAYPKVK